jgi:hypothetical protein
VFIQFLVAVAGAGEIVPDSEKEGVRNGMNICLLITADGSFKNNFGKKNVSHCETTYVSDGLSA